MSLTFSSLTELHQKRLQKEISTKEIVSSCIERIDSVEPKVKAFLHLEKAAAIAKAEEVDKKIQNGEGISILEGMPIAVKDIFNVQGTPTTCGSRILEGYISPYESTVTSKLKEKNYIMIGKTNLDEFGMGSTCENSAFGGSKNPWNLDYVPGGSSGGSSAAVAAGMAVAALGTDTGGSIRQPASFTNLVGIKPTYGLVSRYGIIAYASSFDQAGPITRTVEDAAHVLQAIAGYDNKDSTSLQIEIPDYSQSFNKDIKGKKVGIIKELDLSLCDDDVRITFEKNIKALEDAGAEIQEISIQNLKEAIATYYVIAPCEASSNLGRYDGIRFGHRNSSAEKLDELYKKSREDGFGKETKLRILLGTFALSSGYYDAYYAKAKSTQAMIRYQFKKAFENVDIIATPVSPSPAFKLGEKKDDPLQMYLADAFTVSINLAGIPAISVPGGFSSSGLPIGLQMISSHLKESELFQMSHWFEKNYSFNTPKLAI